MPIRASSSSFGPAATQGPGEDTVKSYLLAAALQDLAAVRFFLEQVNLHPDASYGGKPTALCYAVLKPHIGLLDYLLGRGAGVAHRDGLSMTPLHYAALGGCHCCLARLIAAGAPLNALNRSGLTPLALTLDKPQLAGSRALLESHGATLTAGPPRPKRFH